MSSWAGPAYGIWAKLSRFKGRYRAAPARKAQRASLKMRQASATQMKQVLLDVSIISKNDAQTGIQRVVRAIVSELLYSVPPEGYVVRTVAASRKGPYRLVDWPNEPSQQGDREILVQPGDIFLGLDLGTRIVPAQRKQLVQWQRLGATLYFLIYDLLPVLSPEWFPRPSVVYFQRWLNTLAVLADGVICISPQVNRDFVEYLTKIYRLPSDSIPSFVIPMGNNIAASRPSQGLPQDFEQTLERLSQHKTVLMVGTLEPRKGHAEILDAFDHLWRSGKGYCLVFAGRPGWKTEALQARLKSHPKVNQLMFWFDDASDEVLDQLYRTCFGVVLASKGEGFGLPMLEARGYGKPILARNLPVFREQAIPNVNFFDSDEPHVLAKVIDSWLLTDSLKIFDPMGDVASMWLPTWKQSADAIWETILGDVLSPKTDLNDHLRNTQEA
jgi:glycosyltransferase involved in cell wall biosynthesis